MKFIKLENTQGAEYAVFQLESIKEKDFFKKISPISENSVFGNFSNSTQSWLLNSRPPAILSYGKENEIMIIYNNPYSFNLFSKSQSKPINDFLDYLFKMKIIENNVLDELEKTNQCENILKL